MILLLGVLGGVLLLVALCSLRPRTIDRMRMDEYEMGANPYAD